MLQFRRMKKLKFLKFKNSTKYNSSIGFHLSHVLKLILLNAGDVFGHQNLTFICNITHFQIVNTDENNITAIRENRRGFLNTIFLHGEPNYRSIIKIIVQNT